VGPIRQHWDRIAHLTASASHPIGRDRGKKPTDVLESLGIGCRRLLVVGTLYGEVARPPDVSFDRRTIRIHRSVGAARLPGDERKLRFDSPKSGKARTVELDASTIGAFAAMRERQTNEPVADVGQLVFRRATALGFQPWRPDVTTHVFQRLSKEAKVPVTPFHYLRHCCASWLLGAGLDVVAVAERLGHWNASLTLSTDAHAIRGRQTNSLARSAQRYGRGTFTDMMLTRCLGAGP
jgi:hypothetical protein